MLGSRAAVSPVRAAVVLNQEIVREVRAEVPLSLSYLGGPVTFTGLTVSERELWPTASV